MNRGRRGMHPNEVAAGLAVSRRRTIVTNSTHARHRTAALWSETNTAELDKSRGQSRDTAATETSSRDMSEGQSLRRGGNRRGRAGLVKGTVPETVLERTWRFDPVT